MTGPSPSTGPARRALDRALADAHDAPPCTADPDAFYADDVELRDYARGVCSMCPLTDACLTAAVEEDEKWAVRGGHDFSTTAQRRAARLAAQPEEEAS